MIDDGASQMIGRRLLEDRIEVLTETDISEIRSRDHRLAGVETDQGQVIPCELLIVAKGVHPNIELIRDSDIRKREGIRTDPYMQTNHENIFAAGDVAEAFDITTEEHAVNALWTCAVQQGRIAGLNIVGEQKAYDGAVGMNSLTICNSPLISYGITSPNDTSRYQTLVHEQPANNVYRKIVLEGHRIKGVILLGRIDNAGVLLSLIQRKADVSAFEHELLDDRFNFARLVGYGDPSVLEQYQQW